MKGRKRKGKEGEQEGEEHIHTRVAHRGYAFPGQPGPPGSCHLFQSQAQPLGSLLALQLCGSLGLHSRLEPLT